MGIHQARSFCVAKETIMKHHEKASYIALEKILANHLSDKELISKIYKELIQLNSNKTKQNKQNQKTIQLKNGQNT